MKYHIRFDFDCEGDPPTQHIWKCEGRDEIHIAKVDEAPISNMGKWSWEPDDWEPGPLAKQIVALLNGSP